MSTGCNCLIVGPVQGEWYYVLEHRNAPKNAWDWLDNADAFGPFPSEAAAERHLSDNHANPGGWSRIPHGEYRASESLDRAIRSAADNTARARQQNIGRQFGLPAGAVFRLF